MTASYSYNGGTQVSMTSTGIMNLNLYTVGVQPSSVLDTGIYTISLALIDYANSQITSSFKVEITNIAPRIMKTIPDIQVPLNHL